MARCHLTVSPTTVPSGHAVVPPPADVPECSADGTQAAAPAGCRGDVQGAGREGGGRQEGMGDGRGGRKESAGEGGTGDGRGGRGKGGAGKGAGLPRETRSAGSQGAAARVGGYSEEAGESGEGKAGRRAARGTGAGERADVESLPLRPFRKLGILPEAEREVQERAWKRIRSEATRLSHVVRGVVSGGPVCPSNTSVSYFGQVGRYLHSVVERRPMVPAGGAAVTNRKRLRA